MDAATKTKCEDLQFRLTVYEAGHALCARAMGIDVLRVIMFPRPPTLESDKILRGNNYAALIEVLEDRCVELFGGQIAEHRACGSNTCCPGDAGRIDELTRLIAGLEGTRDAETVWFDLEDVAERIFEDQRYRDAIVPLAQFLHNKVTSGETIIAGEEIETKMDELIAPRPKRKKGLRGLFSR